MLAKLNEEEQGDEQVIAEQIEEIPEEVKQNEDNEEE